MSSVPTCDIYLRLSDARKEEAFEGREAKLRAFADTLGWIVHRVVVENDTFPDGRPKPASAWKKRKIKTPSGRTELRVIRPKFREVLDDMITGRVNAMLTEDLDRALRDPRDAEDLIDACAMAGASVRSISGSLTLTNGGDENEKFMLRTMVNAANKASADTARRVADSRERRNGSSYCGGPRAYGYVPAQETEKYRANLIIVPDEADVLRAAKDDILYKDIPLSVVARRLNEHGVPTVKNGKWTSDSLKKALIKPTVAGLSAHKGALKPAPWDAVLEQDEWARLRDKLTEPSRTPANNGNEPRHLLSWIAKCGVCNNGTTVIVTGGRPKEGARYVCRKMHLSRNARLSDAYVEGLVIEWIKVLVAVEGTKDLLRPPAKEGTDTTLLRKEAKKLQERKATQIRLHALGEIDDADLTTGMRAIRDRLGVVNAQLAVSEAPDPLEEFRNKPVEAVWKSLDLPYKRTVIRRFADITILKPTKRGPGFDLDALHVLLKIGDQVKIDPEHGIVQWPEEAQDMDAWKSVIREVLQTLNP